MTAKVDTLTEWYVIQNIDTIDTPALVIYQERVLKNINTLISMIDDVSRLRPHVKTHKSPEATRLLMAAGINKFKCATIAEAEMLGMCGAQDVLLAYQPTAQKLQRLIELITKYPKTTFSCLVDNYQSAQSIGLVAIDNQLTINIYIDLNVGMNRTGIKPGNEATALYKKCFETGGLSVIGLHAYDGHIYLENYKERILRCNQAFEAVLAMQYDLTKKGFPEPVIIAGGSPTFPIHAKRKDIECSPGTFIYWDYGYSKLCKEQPFTHAALVITRIVSLPSETTLCLDLGHKSIGAENILNNRIYFLNAPELEFISQSEEHLVVKAPINHAYKIGNVLYGLPVHICPTVALYERALVIEDNKATGEWSITARDRKITI